MLILIAEDEPKTARFLRKGLTENGYVVDWASDGEAALEAGLCRDHDLIILDVMLPRRDGWNVLVELRKAGNTAPVLFLTARDEVEDRVRGLNLGADDYLVKPFAFSELLARVRALARRGNGPPREVRYRVADLVVDSVRHRAERAGQDLGLSPKEFALLALLASHAGEVISRAIIAEKVWDMHFDSDMNVIDVAVARLRAKVDAPFTKKLLHTVRSVGYVLDSRD
jgi:two-component system copper resistance phosphate regulon response regulator CusR